MKKQENQQTNNQKKHPAKHTNPANQTNPARQTNPKRHTRPNRHQTAKTPDANHRHGGMREAIE